MQRVSILTRGKVIATTELRAEEEELLLTESQLRSRLAIKLAGAAAERLVMGEISTGVENDLEEATALARDMVARFGMSDEIGMARLFGPDSSAFLGDETPLADISSGDQGRRSTGRSAGSSPRRETEARVLLEHHRTVLDAFAATLAQAETLEGVALQKHLDDLRAHDAAGRQGARARQGRQRLEPDPARTTAASR